MADSTDLHLGRRLRQRRWMLGLTQSQVGDRVGIKFQQVQKYETGQNRISASRLWDLAKALDVPVAYFYEGLNGVEADQEVDASKAESAADGAVVDRESVELVRAYSALPEGPRRRLLDFIKSFARLEAARGSATSAPAAGIDAEELGSDAEASAVAIAPLRRSAG